MDKLAINANLLFLNVYDYYIGFNSKRYSVYDYFDYPIQQPTWYLEVIILTLNDRLFDAGVITKAEHDAIFDDSSRFSEILGEPIPEYLSKGIMGDLDKNFLLVQLMYFTARDPDKIKNMKEWEKFIEGLWTIF